MAEGADVYATDRQTNQSQSRVKTKVDNRLPAEQVLPFDLPPTKVLRDSKRKVFAHYFTPFPISIDNRDPEVDYYTTEYLSPNGEGGKHRAYGGYLRERPLPRPPRPEKNWFALNLEQEVRRAIAIGLDGFTVDILNYTGLHWDRVRDLADAANRVDPGFKVLLMPDMEAGFKDHADELAAAIRTLVQHSSVFRLDDGRAVVAPFNAQRLPAEWWRRWLAEMKANGGEIAFLPLFQGWERFAKEFAPISYGFSDWGSRSPNRQAQWRDVPTKAHVYVPIWMAPVVPQDMRPYAETYWEAGNSELFRTMWDTAISGGADWVQLITWNDYSEHTEISPSTGTQYAFNDLAAYYTVWFKMGRPPKIERDVLYYFHRIQRTTARPDYSKQTTIVTAARSSDSPRDEIELLALLTLPGTLEIEIAESVHRMAAPAGVTSFRVPLKNGRPIFRVIRDGRMIESVRSAFEISDRVIHQDLLYRGGSSSRTSVPRAN